MKYFIHLNIQYLFQGILCYVVLQLLSQRSNTPVVAVRPEDVSHGVPGNSTETGWVGGLSVEDLLQPGASSDIWKLGDISHKGEAGMENLQEIFNYLVPDSLRAKPYRGLK